MVVRFLISLSYHGDNSASGNTEDRTETHALGTGMNSSIARKRG
jgi:hypothetical protein